MRNDPLNPQTENDEAFVARVMMYLDGVCPADEVELLKRELAASPARRDLYVSLCMQEQAVREVLLVEAGGAQLEATAERMSRTASRPAAVPMALTGMAAALALVVGGYWLTTDRAAVETAATVEPVVASSAAGSNMAGSNMASGSATSSSATRGGASDATDMRWSPIEVPVEAIELAGCVTGPGRNDLEHCPQADFDADGDVDLVDILLLQEQADRNS